MAAMQRQASPHGSRTLPARRAQHRRGFLPLFNRSSWIALIAGFAAFATGYYLLAGPGSTYAPPLTPAERQAAGAHGLLAKLLPQTDWFLRLDYFGTSQQRHVGQVVIRHLLDIPQAYRSGLAGALLIIVALMVASAVVTRATMVSRLRYTLAAVGLLLLAGLAQFPHQYVATADQLASVPAQCTIGVVERTQTDVPLAQICSSETASQQVAQYITDITHFSLSHSDNSGQAITAALWLYVVPMTIFQVAVQGLVWLTAITAFLLLIAMVNSRIRYYAIIALKAIVGVIVVGATMSLLLSALLMAVHTTVTVPAGQEVDVQKLGIFLASGWAATVATFVVASGAIRRWE